MTARGHERTLGGANSTLLPPERRTQVVRLPAPPRRPEADWVEPDTSLKLISLQTCGVERPRLLTKLQSN